jgi:hypothetical protein
MVPLGEAYQQGPQQGTAGEVERPAGLRGGQDGDQLLADARRQRRQVDHRQLDRDRRPDVLRRRAGPRGEDRAQRLVAARDLAEGARQHAGIERPLDP